MTVPVFLRLLLASVWLLGAGAWAGETAGAQGTEATGTATATAAAPASAPAAVPAHRTAASSRGAARAAQPRATVAPRPEARPTWAELTAQQQQSLAPLAASWTRLRAAHKRKWLALSEHYPSMPPAEQALLHSRMAEWAALSPRQRTLARMNYGQLQAVPRQDRKARWEAYQALSAEEKRRLADRAAARPVPPTTAAAVQPVPRQKLTRLPAPRATEAGGTRSTVVPSRVDRNTLLPRPAQSAAQP